jgi:hypothetical protein
VPEKRAVDDDHLRRPRRADEASCTVAIAKRSAKSRADAKAAVVSAVANELKDAEGRVRLFRAILDIAGRRLRRCR